MEKKIVVVLTADESKRLIAKGIAKLPEIQKALHEGMVGLPLCTTNGYIYEELSGKSIDKAKYCCGFIFASGFCLTKSDALFPEFVFVKGKEECIDFPRQNLLPYVKKMTVGDVIIKSGNILDRDKQAGVLLGDPNGGEIGEILPYILAKGIHLIVPMTLNKTAPVKISELILETGMEKISLEMSHGMCGMMSLPGKVFTEVEAFDVLTGTKAVPIAMSGMGSGLGAVTLLVCGEESTIDEAWQLVLSIKGEIPLEPIPPCKSCMAERNSGICSLRIKNDYRKFN